MRRSKVAPVSCPPAGDLRGIGSQWEDESHSPLLGVYFSVVDPAESSYFHLRRNAGFPLLARRDPMSTTEGKDITESGVSWHRQVRVWWASSQIWVISAAFLGVYALAVYGAHQYLQETDPPARLTDSFYMALQCFTLDELARGGNLGYPVAFQIARFLGPLVLAYATVYTLFRVFRRQLDRFIVKFHNDHIIICGFGEQGQALAEISVKRNKKIAVIDQSIDGNSEAVRTLRELGGAPILVGDARKPETLKAAGIHKADQVVVLCGSDEANGQVIAAISKAVRSRKRRQLMVMVQITDIELAEQLQFNEVRFGPRNDSLFVDFGCLPSLAATHLLAKYPPVAKPPLGEKSPEKWPTIVLAGAGLMAEALLIAFAENRLLGAVDRSEDTSGVRAQVIVADDGAQEMVDNVRRRYPRISTILDVRCVGFRSCADFIETGAELVYVCLDDESEAVALALSLQIPETKPRRTIVQTWSRHSLLEVTAGSVTGRASIEHVGILDAMDDIDHLLGSATDRFAQAIHDDYREREGASKEARVEWKDLPPEYKEQNRDQAANFEAQLRKIGAHIVPSLSDREHEVFTFTEDEVESLAKSEHTRWMNREIANGYTRGPAGSGRDRMAKTHGAIVPYDELPEVDKNKDRNAVRNIPQVLWLANFHVVRGKESSDDRSATAVTA
jgi:hypothetical protein